MSFPSSQQDNSSQTDNCVWTINVTNCFGQEYFQVIYGVTTYLSLFVFLCSIWLLSWRLYSKPDTKLFKLKGFLTLEGYLFIQIFWGAGRVISCIMLIYNLLPGQWIVRNAVIVFSWYLGLVSVVTYLAGVLRTIPRMHFYRQNPHYKHALHLPNLRGIAGLYASYIAVLGIIGIACSIIAGYLQQYPTANSYNLVRIILAIHFSTCSIGCFLVAIGFIVYGNKLVKIAKEALKLLEGVSGFPSKGSHSTFIMGAELELKHKKLQRSVRKMRIINVAFILIFVFLSIIFGSFAFFHDQILNNIEISKVLAGVTNLMPMILNVAVMAGIAYGEMKVPDKSEPRLDNIVVPMTSNPTSSPSQSPIMERISSDSESVSHSRNNSTDSNAPLLRWPAPAFTVSTRRGSAQLDSPISVTSPTSGTSALATSPTSASTSNKDHVLP